MGNLTAKTSGEIATFMTPASTNIKSLKVYFSPKQSGTGDPSPENIRDIEGWGGVEVNRCGKNLFDYSHDEIKYNYYRDNNGNEVYSTTSFYTITSYPIQPNCKIFLHNDADVFAVRIYFLTQDDQWISRTNWLSSGSKIITFDPIGIPSNCKKIQLHFTTSNPPVLDTFMLLMINNNISYKWKLPDEYQEVEYIENTGTQYLLTNLIFRKDLENPKIEWKHMQIVQPSGDNMLFGYTATNGSVYFEYYSNAERGYSGIGGIRYANIYYPSSLGLNQIAICSMNKEKLVLNEVEFNSNGSYTDLTTVNPMSIFAWTNTSGTSGNYINKGARIYYLRFYNGNNLLSNFIPCYRKSDNEIGMYDTVSQTFYTNQGTGTFLKGNDVNKTFYGGYIDLVSGELVQEWIKYVFDRNSTVSSSGTSTLVEGLTWMTLRKTITSTPPYMVTPNNGDSYGLFTIGDWRRGAVAGKNRAFINSTTRLDVVLVAINGEDLTTSEGRSTFFDYVENNNIPIECVYKLATPITHQLTPTQLQSFVGQNKFWSNADYVEIEYDLIETEDIQKARQKIILNQPHTESVIDDVVNFTTDLRAPLKECKVYFEPVQEGNGDPSPNNVRNITGWNGVSVGLPSEYQEVEYIETDRFAYVDSLISLGQSDFEINCNFELLQYSSNEQPIFSIWTSAYQYWNCFVRGQSNNSQMDVYTAAHHVLTGVTPLNEPKQVTLKRNSNEWLLEYNGKSINWTYAPNTVNDTTIKLFKRGDLAGNPDIRIYHFILKIDRNLSANFIPCYRKSDGEIGMYDTVSKTFYTNSGTGTFLKGDNVNTTIIGNISWSDEVGTVYGGYVDLVKGELVVTNVTETFTSTTSNALTYDTEDSIYFNLIPTYPFVSVYSSGTVPSTTAVGAAPRNGLCNRLKIVYADNWRGTQHINTLCSSYALNGFSIRMSKNLFNLEDEYDGQAKKDAINEYLSENSIVISYELLTPITYQLTPQQLLTFKGTNNIWSNANGQTEVKFWTH